MYRAPKLIAPTPAMRAALAKRVDQHKYSHGHALVLSGPSGRTGAARLAATGALRVGAGLVTLGTPHEALIENAAHLTAVMLTEIDTPAALGEVLRDARITALCIGPGFGIDRAAAFLPGLLQAARATVLDADALSALSQSDPAPELPEHTVLTPHDGEFTRLFPDLAKDIAAGPQPRQNAVQRAAATSGATVLLKGAQTLIASPNGRLALNDATGPMAAPWLATAGAGDVLAGIITGLLARGLAPFEAASYGAWLHAEAARRTGHGLIAEDLPAALAAVLAELLSSSSV